MPAIWAELTGIIVLLVALMTLLGAPVASWLPASTPGPARWALAPVLGLAVATCLLTSLNWVLPAATVAWVGLAPALFATLIVAWRRRKRLVIGRGVAAPALLALVVAVGFSAPLASQHSLGPGGYQSWDGPNYASAQLGLIHNSVLDDD